MSFNQASETNQPIYEPISPSDCETADVSDNDASNEADAASTSSANDEMQFMHELKERHGSSLTRFVGQITLELLGKYKNNKDYSFQASVKRAFIDTHDMVIEIVTNSKEFAVNLDEASIKPERLE